MDTFNEMIRSKAFPRLCVFNHEISKPSNMPGSPEKATTNTIVLYLYIYKALLAVHTNQCGRPREKRAILRERKEALGSPANEVDCVEGRSWFQNKGPMIAKARV